MGDDITDDGITGIHHTRLGQCGQHWRGTQGQHRTPWVPHVGLDRDTPSWEWPMLNLPVCLLATADHRDRTAQRAGKMSYEDFVWFLLSEEDKTTPTSIEYWFRCMDLDGDGALSAFELEFFYEEQSRRLRSLDVEPLPFPDCLCQMLDLVRPRTQGRITLGDLKRCRLLAPIFFDTFFNVDKYLDREQHEQLALPGDGDGPELSDWDRFAAAEYRLLVAEEAAAQLWEDGSDTDEPSPGKQQPSGLRPQRPFWEASGAELLEEEDDLWPA